MTPLVRPSVLVDIDSTLYDANKVWCKIFAEVVGIKMTPADVIIWDYRSRLVSREVFHALIRDHLHSREGILARTPYQGAPQALQAWHRRGVKITIASDRAPDLEGVTRDWLERWHIPFDVLLTDAAIDKVDYAKSHGVTLVIDDKPATIEAAHTAGLAVATMLHAYNEPLVRATGVIGSRSWRVIRARVEATVPGFAQAR